MQEAEFKVETVTKALSIAQTLFPTVADGAEEPRKRYLKLVEEQNDLRTELQKAVGAVEKAKADLGNPYEDGSEHSGYQNLIQRCLFALSNRPQGTRHRTLLLTATVPAAGAKTQRMRKKCALNVSRRPDPNPNTDCLPPTPYSSKVLNTTSNE